MATCSVRAVGIFRSGSFVLLHRLKSDGFWSLPGGRVEPGETGAEALTREMREELGETVECENMAWVVENFFTLGVAKHHEVGLYFLARLQASSRSLSRVAAFPGKERLVPLEFEWFERSRLAALDIRPRPVRDLLARGLETSFQHLVHHDVIAP